MKMLQWVFKYLMIYKPAVRVTLQPHFRSVLAEPLGTYPLRKARETYLPRGKRPLAKKTVIRSQKKEEYLNLGPL